jgi:hypothetical protein
LAEPRADSSWGSERSILANSDENPVDAVVGVVVPAANDLDSVQPGATDDRSTDTQDQLAITGTVTKTA